MKSECARSLRFLYVSLVDSQPAWLASCQLYISTAAVLFADPRDATVEANEWTQFNCTVRCDYHVSWHVAGHPDINAIGRNNLVRLRTSRCTDSNERTHFIEVLATKALNKSTFYCAASEQHDQERNCGCGTGGRCYSRPALFTGKHVCNAA